MRSIFIPFSIFFLLCNCNGSDYNSKGKVDTLRTDTLSKAINVKEIIPHYDTLLFERTDLLKSSSGTKSVVFNQKKTFLYALNLEGMSVYEFSCITGKVSRIFKFRRTPGTG